MIARGGGGGTLKFTCIRRLGPFFGLTILIFDNLLVFQKNKYFFGYGDISGYFFLG